MVIRKKRAIWKVLKIHLLVALAIFAFATPASPQSEAQNQEIITLQHVKKEKREFHVFNQTKVKVTTLDGTKIKGFITGLKGDSIFVDSSAIAIDQIDVVKVKKVGKVGARITGYILSGIGLLGVILGGLFGFVAWRTSEEPTTSASQGCGQALAVVFLLILAILLGAAGLIFLGFGLGALLFGYLAGKRFRLRKNWRLKPFRKVE